MPLLLSVVALMVPVPVPPAFVKTTVSPPVVRLFPPGSFACSVRVTALPDATVPLETLIVEVLVVAPPTLTVTKGSVDVTADPPIVAWIVVAVPAVTPVKVAAYVPLPLSVVVPMVPVLVPPEAVKTTVAPPAVRLFPAASLAWSVSVTLLPEATVPLETLTVDVATDAGPGVTVTVGRVDVTAEPPMVAPTVVAVPATTPVNVAV